MKSTWFQTPLGTQHRTAAGWSERREVDLSVNVDCPPLSVSSGERIFKRLAVYVPAPASPRFTPLPVFRLTVGL